MVARRYIPDRGDVVWVSLDPTTGHEQTGRRPAIVVSARLYNEKSGLAIMCPITSVSKNYPFEVPVSHQKIQGVVLADQLRAIDWKARHCVRVARMPAPALLAVTNKIALVLGFDLFDTRS